MASRTLRCPAPHESIRLVEHYDHGCGPPAPTPRHPRHRGQLQARKYHGPERRHKSIPLRNRDLAPAPRAQGSDKPFLHDLVDAARQGRRDTHLLRLVEGHAVRHTPCSR